MATTHGDLILTRGDPQRDRSLQRQAAAGKLRRVGDGIYAVCNGRPVEEIVCGGWAPILARYAPGAVLRGRTALQRNPWRERGPDGRVVFPGWVFATDPHGKARRRLSLPGLEIRTFPGPGPLEGDMSFLGVYLPSDARALLENLQASRARSGPSRTVGREGVEREVERLLKTAHEDGLREIRQRAECIAGSLGAEQELQVLLDIIGTILGTRKAGLVARDVAARRRPDDPYDPEYMERLKVLAMTLGRVAPDLADPHVGPGERDCTSFVEAYFTNYIEGTRFLVDKARRIVFEHEPADGRPQDGRDVTQTFAQVASIVPGEARASSVDEFMAEIRERNARLLDARPDKKPGEFKEDANSAGNTVFVLPDLVKGTLREGFAMLRDLQAPFARGVFAHTLIVLVHPFNDGNGRTARIMMTKELVGGGKSRIVVPTIYRSDYIGGLRALTAPGAAQAAPLVRAMLRCQSVTARIASPDLDETLRLWASTHAFLEDEKNARFTDPNVNVDIVWRRGIPAPASYWQELDLTAQLQDDVTGLIPLEHQVV